MKKLLLLLGVILILSSCYNSKEVNTEQNVRLSSLEWKCMVLEFALLKHNAGSLTWFRESRYNVTACINGEIMEYDLCVSDFTVEEAVLKYYKNFYYIGTSDTIYVDTVLNDYDYEMHFFKRRYD